MFIDVINIQVLSVLSFTVFLKLLPTYSYEISNPCAIFCSVTTIVSIYNKIKFRLLSQSLCVTSFSSPFIYLLLSQHSNCKFILGNIVIISWTTINSTLQCRTAKLLNGYIQKLRYEESLQKVLCNLMTKAQIHLKHTQPPPFCVCVSGRRD